MALTISNPPCGQARFRYLTEDPNWIYHDKGKVPKVSITSGGQLVRLEVALFSVEHPTVPHVHRLTSQPSEAARIENGVYSFKTKGDISLELKLGVQMYPTQKDQNGYQAENVEKEQKDYMARCYKFSVVRKLALESFDRIVKSRRKVSLRFQLLNELTNDVIAERSFEVNNSNATADFDYNIAHHLPLSCSAIGGDKMIIVCGKLHKGKFKVVFRAFDDTNRVKWKKDFSPDEVQYFEKTTIVLQIPPYKRPDISSPRQVYISVEGNEKKLEVEDLNRREEEALKKGKILTYLPCSAPTVGTLAATNVCRSKIAPQPSFPQQHPTSQQHQNLRKPVQVSQDRDGMDDSESLVTTRSRSPVRPDRDKSEYLNDSAQNVFMGSPGLVFARAHNSSQILAPFLVGEISAGGDGASLPPPSDYSQFTEDTIFEVVNIEDVYKDGDKDSQKGTSGGSLPRDERETDRERTSDAGSNDEALSSAFDNLSLESRRALNQIDPGSFPLGRGSSEGPE